MDKTAELVIRDSALSVIGLPTTDATSGVAISACVLAPRDPDEGMQVSIGRMLGERARSAMSETLAGRTPTGISGARLAGSDEASCEDPPGGGVRSAFIEGKRCFRLDLRIVVDE
jgi:hypothetical protein